jgi:hypothetical protein
MTKDKALDLALEALEKSLPKLAPYGEQDWLDSRAAIKAIKQARSAPVQEPVGVYGHCPVCGAKGITRERRPGGNDRCANGHTYKSIHATTPPAQPAPVQEPVDSVQAIGNLMFALTTWKATTSKTAPAAWKKLLQACADMVATEQPAPVQEPVAFLANGTRFKISYDSRQSGGQIHGIPPELGGRWVAFVAAEDDCHLKLTTPPAAQRQWVGLTDEDKLHIEIMGGKSDVMLAEMVEAKLKELNT